MPKKESVDGQNNARLLKFFRTASPTAKAQLYPKLNGKQKKIARLGGYKPPKPRASAKRAKSTPEISKAIDSASKKKGNLHALLPGRPKDPAGGSAITSVLQLFLRLAQRVYKKHRTRTDEKDHGQNVPFTPFLSPG